MKIEYTWHEKYSKCDGYTHNFIEITNLDCCCNDMKAAMNKNRIVVDTPYDPFDAATEPIAYIDKDVDEFDDFVPLKFCPYCGKSIEFKLTKHLRDTPVYEKKKMKRGKWVEEEFEGNVCVNILTIEVLEGS